MNISAAAPLRIRVPTTALVWLVLSVTGLTAAVPVPAGPAPLPPRVSARLADAAELLAPSAVHVDGWIGARIAANAKNRLLPVDLEPFLAGFRKKPGSHPWIGEHAGKWLHAATLAWANSGDAALRAKLDRVAADLVSAQEPDGYLGTYLPGQRFVLAPGTDWDVWAHKYCLIGLLTYHQYTGDAPSLAACRKAADLLLATFPAQRSILAAGKHTGMAATSVLEPIVLLHRITGDARYLDFAHYLVRAWDEPKGPAIVKTLLAEKQVNKVGNAKGYEMLSNLVGLCDLARVTGERAFIDASLHAWRDIVDRRLYLTGTSTQWEHFRSDHELRNDVQVHLGETCVTTTWIQLNLSLLQLTGEARFGDELERALYNHLTAAQHPRGDDWCYYTALEGRKQYDAGITCCHSSGPRALALAPQACYLTTRTAIGGDTLLVSTFETSRANVRLGGQPVTVEQQSGFPRTGGSVLTFRLPQPATFAIKIRVPAWAAPVQIAGATLRDGWAELPPRLWKDGDRLPVNFTLAARLVRGEHGNTGRAALAWGPFVLAYEQAANPALPAPHLLGLTGAPPPLAPLPGAALAFEVPVVTAPAARAQPAKFLTFADAGTERGTFRVWLRAPGVAAAPGDSVLFGGTAASSRAAHAAALNDDDYESTVSTKDGRHATEDWFSVSLPQPASARRFVFTQGKRQRDGGWFDASAGQPRVQIRRTAGTDWETLGVLGDYPAATAVTSDVGKGAWGSHQFTLKLPATVSFSAVRVIGTPASGENPTQAFVACNELQAFLQ